MISIKQKVNLTLVAVLCAFLFSCDIEFWKDPSLVMAEVGGSRLYLHELKEDNSTDKPVSKEEWARRIEYWVNSEVMYKEALKLGLQKDPATQKLIKNAERKILIDRLRVTMDSGTDTESDKELQEFYENNKEMFRIDSTSFIPFSKAMPQIQSIILSEKRIKREKKWLAEIKNHYSIEVYPQYLDSL